MKIPLVGKMTSSFYAQTESHQRSRGGKPPSKSRTLQHRDDNTETYSVAMAPLRNQTRLSCRLNILTRTRRMMIRKSPLSYQLWMVVLWRSQQSCWLHSPSSILFLRVVFLITGLIEQRPDDHRLESVAVLGDIKLASLVRQITRNIKLVVCYIIAALTNGRPTYDISIGLTTVPTSTLLPATMSGDNNTVITYDQPSLIRLRFLRGNYIIYNSPESTIVTLFLGFPALVPSASTIFTTSSPSRTLPKTT
jgi:uncharacterized membrane protein